LPAAATADAGAPPPTSPPFAAVTERPAAGPAALAPPPASRPPEKPLALPDSVRWTGEQLRKAREARGLTVIQLAEKTRITRHHIENVEADRFEKLPAAVYLRGIVMSLARELRLDGQKVARSYLEHQAGTQGKA
jgi:ribosome-binding protein aMBF1 (putative translation factor)